MYAVTIEALNAVIFLVGPPGDLPGQVQVQDDVDLDIPTNIGYWSDGESRANPVLCVARDDPKSYAIFRDARDVDPARYVLTGRHFGGFYSRASWRRFVEKLPDVLRFCAIPDDDPPGAMDEVIRTLTQAR